MNQKPTLFIPFTLLVSLFSGPARSEDETYAVREFERVRITEEYYAEGANVGDFNRDGRLDIVCGPHWFAGPQFTARYPIYEGRSFPNDRGYSNNFFSFVADVNGDGWDDVLVVGLPGTPAHWYENPRASDSSEGKIWPKRLAFRQVDNEAPVFADLTGDGRPELICTFEGRLGYASSDPKNPEKEWTWTAVSAKGRWHRFSHGLGIGDVNGDGRKDFLMPTGWWEQPEAGAADREWTHHPARFGAAGAEIYTEDVDGDGDADVITSVHAHAWGLSWYEQKRGADGEIVFTEHRIMGERPEENPYGLAFSQLHAVDLADVDGDGLRDIVTGKCYWAHNGSDPGARDPAVVYYFRLVRNPDGLEFVPHLVDDDSGVGRQVVARDVDGDGHTDIIAANKKGTWLFRQRTRPVSRAEWERAQPKRRQTPPTAKKAESAPVNE